MNMTRNDKIGRLPKAVREHDFNESTPGVPEVGVFRIRMNSGPVSGPPFRLRCLYKYQLNLPPGTYTLVASSEPDGRMVAVAAG
jgi:hypothetical protein